MKKELLYIHAKNGVIGLILLTFLSVLFLGLKLYVHPVTDGTLLTVAGVLALVSIVMIGKVYSFYFKMIRRTKKIKTPSELRLTLIKLVFLKAFFSLLWLVIIFYPFHTEVMFDQALGYVFIFCCMAVISSTGVAYFSLFLWDMLTYVGFAAVIVWVNWGVQETPYVGLFLAVFALYSILSARQSCVTTKELTKKTYAMKDAVKRANLANRAKTDFLAMMSHEIRTPLNGIMGMVELLKDSGVTKEQTESLEIISNCSDVLLNTLNDVIDLSKVEAGKLAINHESFDFIALMRNAKSITEPLAREKGLELVFETDPKTPKYIYADPNRLQQIVVNFLNNAIKFTDEGKVTLKIGNGQSDSNFIRVEVIDTGIGISEADQKKLFSKFSQVDVGAGRNTTGAGLGLSISKKLVFLMNGTVDVHSVEGEGSTFWFEFPYGDAHWADEDMFKHVAVEEMKSILPLNILLAEDNKINQLIAVKLLEKRGHVVRVASDGEKAVQMVQEEEYDLILMDINMPLMNGIDATKQIKVLAGRYADIPIVAMTAFTQDRYIEECKAVGIDDYISKPFHPEDLDVVLMRYGSVDEVGAPQSKAADVQENEEERYQAFNVLMQEFGEEYCRHFLEISKEEIERLVDAILQAVEEHNMDVVVSCVHDLKGVSGNLGLEQTKLISIEIEASAANSDLTDVTSYAKKLKKTSGKELRDLENMVSEL